MAYPRFTPQQVEELGEAFFQESIRDKLSREDNGRFVVIDVTSSNYEIADTDLQATRKLLAEHPQAVIYGIRVGSEAAYTLGAHLDAANL
jgi:hypothetical protein